MKKCQHHPLYTYTPPIQTAVLLSGTMQNILQPQQSAEGNTCCTEGRKELQGLALVLVCHDSFCSANILPLEWDLKEKNVSRMQKQVCICGSNARLIKIKTRTCGRVTKISKDKKTKACIHAEYRLLVGNQLLSRLVLHSSTSTEQWTVNIISKKRLTFLIISWAHY